MWLGAIFSLSFLCGVQAESLGSSKNVQSLESILKQLKDLKEEAEDALSRFRGNRPLYSNRISGGLHSKTAVFPEDDIISALSETLESVHEKAVKFINDRISLMKWCAASKNNFRRVCLKLAQKFRQECKEALVKRNSDLWEQSKDFLRTHGKNVDQKNAEIIHDININLNEIGTAIVTAFSQKLQEFEASYETSLPWQVKLDCLEEASTLKRNMSDEDRIFSKQMKQEVQDCQLRSNANLALLRCLRKPKDNIDQKLIDFRKAVNINFETPFLKAEECVQNYLKGDDREGHSKDINWLNLFLGSLF